MAPADGDFTATIGLNWRSLRLGEVRMGNVAPAELTARQIIDGGVVSAKEMAAYRRKGWKRTMMGRQKANEGAGDVDMMKLRTIYVATLNLCLFYVAYFVA